ncbi:MAG: hypothetical protein D6776_09465 [Planctomycetota bacterium]|nr:MAG: hypothetical protein D6776_09465 [Planctomycetota bacterium]
MLDTHERSRADVTVAVTPVSEQQVPSLGIMRTAADGRIVEFVEKPTDPETIARLRTPGLPGGCTHLASMGIYLIRRERLAALLEREHATDFGKHVIPMAIREDHVQSHLFTGYWEDIGTIRAFYEANLALARPDPPFDLYDAEHRFYTRQRHLPPTRYLGESRVSDSLIADGCTIERCTIEGSVIGIRTRVREGARIENSIVFGHDHYRDPCDGNRPLEIGAGAVIRRAIIDKNVSIGAGARLINAEGVLEAETDLVRIRDGILCVPKGKVIPAGTVI